jgi:glycosyltransferase involved in cell wall biosynthesis
MKILHINDFFYPFIAGPTNHIIDVINHTFHKNSHSVISFDYNDNLKSNDWFDNIPIKRYEPIHNDELFRYIQLGYKNNNSLSDFVDYVRSKKHACVVLYFIGSIPYFIRNVMPEQRVVFFPFGFNNGDYQQIYRSKRFKIALCGDGSLNDFIESGADPNQINVIERPIDTDYYTPMNVDRDPYRLLFVGRFHPMKRIPELIKMLLPLFEDYSELHLHIIADTENVLYTGVVNDELEKVKEIITKYDLYDRVIIRGKLTGIDLLREYSEASIHVLPSNKDRRATVVQEAITMGMQCVNTCKRSYDWPEFTQSGERLIHYVNEIEDMAPVLRKLLETNNRISNREYALKNWSWHKWKPVYEKLLSEW